METIKVAFQLNEMGHLANDMVPKVQMQKSPRFLLEELNSHVKFKTLKGSEESTGNKFYKLGTQKMFQPAQNGKVGRICPLKH